MLLTRVRSIGSERSGRQLSWLSILCHQIVLYSCELGIVGEAAFTEMLLGCTDPTAIDPVGENVVARCSNGSIEVEEPINPTATRSPTGIPTHTSVRYAETPTPTNSVPPIPTLAPTVAPPAAQTDTPVGAGGGGCAIAQPASSSPAWFFIVPVGIGMLGFRQRLLLRWQG